jgi:hypothetical protein
MTATVFSVGRVSKLPHRGHFGCQPDSFFLMDAKASKSAPHSLQT